MDWNLYSSRPAVPPTVQVNQSTEPAPSSSITVPAPLPFPLVSETHLISQAPDQLKDTTRSGGGPSRTPKRPSRAPRPILPRPPKHSTSGTTAREERFERKHFTGITFISLKLEAPRAAWRIAHAALNTSPTGVCTLNEICDAMQRNLPEGKNPKPGTIQRHLKCYGDFECNGSKHNPLWRLTGAVNHNLMPPRSRSRPTSMTVLRDTVNGTPEASTNGNATSWPTPALSEAPIEIDMEYEALGPSSAIEDDPELARLLAPSATLGGVSDSIPPLTYPTPPYTPLQLITTPSSETGVNTFDPRASAAGYFAVYTPPLVVDQRSSLWGWNKI